MWMSVCQFRAEHWMLRVSFLRDKKNAFVTYCMGVVSSYESLGRGQFLVL